MGKGILVFALTKIRGMSVEAALPTPASPWRAVVGALYHDSSKLRLSAGLGLTCCVHAPSRNDLASLVDICWLSYKGGPYLQIALCGGGVTMQLCAMLVIAR
jgi:hypothetical protein